METEAHYRRIASEIQERIRSGRLMPGDRVPSTRAIVRDWGIAMATATKVLATLRSEGSIETRPGYGSVVRSTEPSPPPLDSGLTAERIVATAVALADAEGLSATTMRRVAVELGVATMSLYRHVENKEILVELMTDKILRERPMPTQPVQWRTRLDNAARTLWAAFRRHPWAASTVSLTRPQLLPSLLGYAELSLSTFRDLGFDVDTCMNAHLTLFAYIQSAASSLDAESQARRDTGLTNEEWIDETEVLLVAGSGKYPAFEWVVRAGYNYDVEKIFTFGLERLLDGFAQAAGR